MTKELIIAIFKLLQEFEEEDKDDLSDSFPSE
jgi:hypothetical protein